MKTIVVDPIVEARLYQYAEKVRPYLNEAFSGPNMSTRHNALHERLSEVSK